MTTEITGRYEINHDLSRNGTDGLKVDVETVDQAGAYGTTQHFATLCITDMDYNDRVLTSVSLRFNRAGLEKVIAEAQRLLDGHPAREFSGVGPRGHGS